MNRRALEDDFPVDEETFAFGSFRLIPAQRTLLEDGNPLRLGSRAVYDRFTEGFDTADLREAKSLLEHLTDMSQASQISETQESPSRRTILDEFAPIAAAVQVAASTNRSV